MIKKATILIAEDHEGLRRTMCTLFDGHSFYTVIGEAADGQEAIDQAKNLKPDVVILDNRMPKIHGFDAIVPIREVSPDTKIIMHTSYDDKFSLRLALERGALGYLIKGDDSDLLDKAIRNVLENNPFISMQLHHHLVEAFLKAK